MFSSCILVFVYLYLCCNLLRQLELEKLRQLELEKERQLELEKLRQLELEKERGLEILYGSGECTSLLEIISSPAVSATAELQNVSRKRNSTSAF